MKKKSNTKINRPYLFFTILVGAIMAIICALFFNMKRPISNTTKFDNGVNDTDRGVSVSITPRSGDGGSWIKAMNVDGLKGKYLGKIYDLTVESVGIGKVDDWSLRINITKPVYLNQAWSGKVEVHQVKDNITQTLGLRGKPAEEVILKHYVDGSDFLIELDEGDYLIYYPSEPAGEVPLLEDQCMKAGLVLYTLGIGGYKFDDCEINYTITSDYRNMPEFYIIILLLGLFILMMTYFFIVLFQNRRTRVLYEHEKKIARETMSTFVGFVDAKDPYTAGHSERVASYTKLIAEKMGYGEDEASEAYYCALLHDAGKISVAEEVLNKKGALDREEFEAIKQHTVKGYEMLRNLSTVPLAATAARSHHERFDGTGYPDGLKSYQIPEIARIISVADAFDAMNSNRVYRKALDRDSIINQLVVHKGTQFDPDITDIFLELLKKGDIDAVEDKKE